MFPGYEFYKNLNVDDIYAQGHGLKESDGGLFGEYRNLYELEVPNRVLVIGSGTGLIPIIFSNIASYFGNPISIDLVDAILPNVGYGGPHDAGGWIYPDSVLNRKYPKIVCHYQKSIDFFSSLQFYEETGIKIYDWIYVDGDHSLEGVSEDLLNSSKHIETKGSILLHDFNLRSVVEATSKFLDTTDWKLYKQSKIGAGLGIIKHKEATLL